MVNETEPLKEGWGFPLNSRKAHYFLDSRSLCMRWLFFGKLEPADKSSPDDCKTCTKKLQERQLFAQTVQKVLKEQAAT